MSRKVCVTAYKWDGKTFDSRSVVLTGDNKAGMQPDIDAFTAGYDGYHERIVPEPMCGLDPYKITRVLGGEFAEGLKEGIKAALEVTKAALSATPAKPAEPPPVIQLGTGEATTPPKPAPLDEYAFCGPDDGSHVLKPRS